MHLAELTQPEQRVLGCLIEKRWTTPDQYPLSLNALRLACNQSTNRDPVTAYDEGTVREAAQRLYLYGLARLASGHGSRSVKYRHLAEEALGLDREELAVLAVLLLRGPQTPGELKARTDRMAHLESLAEVDRVLTVLGERDYARRLGRRPGQKEDRFEHLLGPRGETDANSPAPAQPHADPSRSYAAPPGSAATAQQSHADPTGSPATAAQPHATAAQPHATAAQPHATAPQPLTTPPEPHATQPPPHATPAATPPQISPAGQSQLNGALAERIATLESEVASLRAEIDELRDLLTTPAAH